MNGDQIFNSINNIQIIIKNHKDEIEKLDQEIGDGDHIFNIMRGLDELLNLKDDLIDKPIDHIFKQLGMKIMTTVGGSSGALFATLLIGMSKKYNADLNALNNLAEMFFEGVQSMKKRGKADIGEKTMLDVLIPVSNILIDLKNEKDFDFKDLPGNNPEDLKGIIENHIGYMKIPMSIVGPALINGNYANGNFSIPLCTIEGTLAASMNRGLYASSLCGGIHVKHFRQELSRAPIFIFDDINQSQELRQD